MEPQQRTEIDEALMDALAAYAMALQGLLRAYVDEDTCHCPEACIRCEALALLDGAA